MKVLFVTSEIAGLYKRGGLADVSYSLPVALSKKGIHVSIAMPYYEHMTTKAVDCVGQMAIDFDRRRELIFIFRTMLPDTTVPVYLFRHPLFHVYDDPHIMERFAFFSKAVAQLYIYSQETLGGPYDVMHCNDWHTALVPLLVGENRKMGYRERETVQSLRVKTMLTIHNLLYQGETSSTLALKLGCSRTAFHPFMTPLGRAVRLLEEGMEYADCVTTVSPTYADEIMKGEHGKRVQEVFMKRHAKIVGVLNGIDQHVWDPQTDTALPKNYDVKTVVSGKQTVKKALKQALRLPDLDVPLFGFVGRFESRQKGLDLIAKAIGTLPKGSFQIALLGTGQKHLVHEFTELAKYNHHVSFTHTFDERLARRIYAGSDVMLVPSKFEPCGLTQMIAMRYGTLPLVRKTGGLADSVQDGKNGFVFNTYTTTALVSAMKRAIVCHFSDPKKFSAMKKCAMQADFSWDTQAGEYIKLYKKLMKKLA